MTARAWAATMAALTALFALRVLGQALQVALPVAWLPPAGAWQGSGTPYPLLLAIQLLIVALMARASLRAWSGTLATSRAALRACAWLGGIYLAGSLARIAVGLLVPGAPAWFSAWISGAFHVVLAAFVLALAGYHRAAIAARGGASP